MTLFNVTLLGRREIAEHTFEICLSRPTGFDFNPGQWVRLSHAGIKRDYSLINAPGENKLRVCVRQVARGRLSTLLADLPPGSNMELTGPEGYFTFKPTGRVPVFVATGTGIAPFVAMARAGVAGFMLLHGVRSDKELYYKALLLQAARTYTPCISGAASSREKGCFNGRVTEYIERRLEPGGYDFYLCGRREMIRDVLWLVDDRFPGSLVYTETFF